MYYLTPIKYAFIVFPVVAFLITFPYMINQYHKYGSISLFKSSMLYLFVLYLINAYFLVILPLPKISEVELLKTPRMQLIPFNFIMDFIRETPLKINDIKTYKDAILSSSFFVPIFNVFLTIPFGIFLKYYKKYNTKKVVIYTFLLTLFFELTQLSGLYFIYPRGYRLFDVDDLLLNTLGGYLGSLIILPFIKYLPDFDMIDKNLLERGKFVSGLKRTTSMILDIGIYLIIDFILFIFTRNLEISSLILFVIYYFIIPIILNGSTIGQKIINLKEISNSNNKILNILLLMIRKILFIILYLVIPVVLVFALFYIYNDVITEMGIYIIFGVFLSFYLIIIIKYVFTSSKLVYEKLSGTLLVSTIKK